MKLRTDSIATAGPKRQKSGERKTDAVTDSSALSPPCFAAAGFSGTERKIHSATAAAIAHSSHSTPRQPSDGSAAWTGAVVSTLPSPPIATAMPVTLATFAGANHWVFALMTAISPAETPTPMITRARTKPPRLSDSANTAKPAAAGQAERPLHAPRPESVERDAVRELRHGVGGEHARREQPELAPGQRRNPTASTGPMIAMTVRAA